MAIFSDNCGTVPGHSFSNGFHGAALTLINATFQSNSANGAGGAVAAYETGDVENPATFSRCHFFDNKANGVGGLVKPCLDTNSSSLVNLTAIQQVRREQTVLAEISF